MLQFFDYVYYIIWKFYNKYEENAGVRALIVLVALQLFNIMTLIYLFRDYTHMEPAIGYVKIILILIILIVPQLIRYNRKDLNYKVFDEWWGQDNNGKKHPKLIWAQLYILVSTMAFLVTSFYTIIARN